MQLTLTTPTNSGDNNRNCSEIKNILGSSLSAAYSGDFYPWGLLTNRNLQLLKDGNYIYRN